MYLLFGDCSLKGTVYYFTLCLRDSWMSFAKSSSQGSNIIAGNIKLHRYMDLGAKKESRPRRGVESERRTQLCYT